MLYKHPRKRHGWYVGLLISYSVIPFIYASQVFGVWHFPMGNLKGKDF